MIGQCSACEVNLLPILTSVYCQDSRYAAAVCTQEQAAAAPADPAAQLRNEAAAGPPVLRDPVTPVSARPGPHASLAWAP